MMSNVLSFHKELYKRIELSSEYATRNMYIERRIAYLTSYLFFGINKTKAIYVMQVTKYFIAILDKRFIDDSTNINFKLYQLYSEEKKDFQNFRLYTSKLTKN